MKKREVQKNRKILKKPSATNNLFMQYVTASSSASTRRGYASDVAHFRNWGGHIPSTPTIVARYLAEHAVKLSYATLSRRLVAISHAHSARGLRSPTCVEVVRATMRGIRRMHRPTQRQAIPLLREDLRKRIRTAPGLRGIRDRALLLVGFAGGFRASEIVGLNVEDIEYVKSGVTLRLRKSKTDQEGRGRTIAIPLGKRDPWNCPVRMLRAWLKRSGVESDAIFRKVDRNNRVCGERLSTQVVALIVKHYAQLLGKDPAGYSGHSLRAGFVTSAAEAGMPTWKIRQQTGHKSELMVMRYIRPTSLFEEKELLSLL